MPNGREHVWKISLLEIEGFQSWFANTLLFRDRSRAVRTVRIISFITS
jgi:hypothetical protein